MAKDADVLRNEEKIPSPATSMQLGVDRAGSTKQSTLAVEGNTSEEVCIYTHEA